MTGPTMQSDPIMMNLRAVLFCLMLLPVSSVRADYDTTAAESPAFALETRDFASTTEAFSQNFALDIRDRGNSDSVGSGTFLLNTLGDAPTELEIVGPSSVVAGSKTDYQVIWHAGYSDLDVTSGVHWRFLTGAPVNTGMVL